MLTAWAGPNPSSGSSRSSKECKECAPVCESTYLNLYERLLTLEGRVGAATGDLDDVLARLNGPSGLTAYGFVTFLPHFDFFCVLLFNAIIFLLDVFQ